MRSRYVVGLRKVISGVEEENGNARIQFDGEFGEQNIFGLKAACEANVMIARDFTGNERAGLVESGLNFAVYFRGAHCFPQGPKPNPFLLLLRHG